MNNINEELDPAFIKVRDALLPQVADLEQKIKLMEEQSKLENRKRLLDELEILNINDTEFNNSVDILRLVREDDVINIENARKKNRDELSLDELYAIKQSSKNLYKTYDALSKMQNNNNNNSNNSSFGVNSLKNSINTNTDYSNNNDKDLNYFYPSSESDIRAYSDQTGNPAYKNKGWEHSYNSAKENIDNGRAYLNEYRLYDIANQNIMDLHSDLTNEKFGYKNKTSLSDKDIRILNKGTFNNYSEVKSPWDYYEACDKLNTFINEKMPQYDFDNELLSAFTKIK